MRRNSHICLGQYLIDQYMQDLGHIRRRLFLLGCIQPDINPLTYLKGSLRCQWLRGHNYSNARPFICRISRRLESRKVLALRDYYTLGKLIHYTADVFTYAHNAHFIEKLSQHREYEKMLQKHFLTCLWEFPAVPPRPGIPIADTVRGFHDIYSRQLPHVHTDSIFTLQVSCCILAALSSRLMP